MTLGVDDHYSYNFALKIGNKPSKAVDRFSRLVTVTAFVLGLMLFLLGVYHFTNSDLSGVTDIENSLPKTNIKIHSFISPDIFNLLVMSIGIFVMMSCFVMYVRYNKIFFDGNYVKVKKRPVLGPIQVFEEPLYNYSGVRLRVKFYQFGILNLNKYIIELYHKDTNKIVPLYISLKKKNIRQIWKEYATLLHMPGITMSERGMVSRNFQDLNRNYEEVVSKWHMPQNFIFELDKPSYITFKKRQSGEKMIKIGKIFVDAYSVLYTCLCALLFIAMITALIYHSALVTYIKTEILLIGYAFTFTLLLFGTINFLSKDIILLTKDKIIVFRKVVFLRVRDSIIDIKHIKGIDINYTPTTDRYYLSIVSDKNLVTVGHKLPAQDLRWIRAVLISEIIGN
ncbi:MAG: hypothetical protein IJF12_00755 [Alphaproteobacteria bacterium]|nr:hypothetical protein [Alphaproteobacteria bacterium]MBQ2810680.1 hypothetical protein [Alphaproteobacteria bacterium]